MQRNALALLCFAFVSCTPTMEVHTPEGTFEVEYFVKDGLRMAEDDIVLSEDYKEPLFSFGPSLVGNGIVSKQWPNAVMPYEIDPALPNAGRVTTAIEIWTKATKARFVKRTTERDFVYFTKRSGCYSSIGRVGGRQIISLDDSCSYGNAVHEIAHAFGMWHEQARPDRDTFVTVHMSNVKPEMRHNFNKVTGNFVRQLSPYDYESIMHYPWNAFCIDCRKATITRKDGKPISGQRSYLSANDIAGFAALYGTKQSAAPTATPTPRPKLTLRTVTKDVYTPPGSKEHVRFGIEMDGDIAQVESVEYEINAALPKIPLVVAPFDLATWAAPGWQAGKVKVKLKGGDILELPITAPERK